VTGPSLPIGPLGLLGIVLVAAGAALLRRRRRSGAA
jgi:LPXTG-motif cell wall-anchored protein